MPSSFSLKVWISVFVWAIVILGLLFLFLFFIFRVGRWVIDVRLVFYDCRDSHMVLLVKGLLASADECTWGLVLSWLGLLIC